MKLTRDTYNYGSPSRYEIMDAIASALPGFSEIERHYRVSSPEEDRPWHLLLGRGRVLRIGFHLRKQEKMERQPGEPAEVGRIAMTSWVHGWTGIAKPQVPWLLEHQRRTGRPMIVAMVDPRELELIVRRIDLLGPPENDFGAVGNASWPCARFRADLGAAVREAVEAPYADSAQRQLAPLF